MINILVTSFSGLGLPSTLSVPVQSSATITEFVSQLVTRLPAVDTRLILTTNSNKQITQSSTEPISSLLDNKNDAFIPLRLSVPLCGGKGGFGSQLRAAGGRMSSKRKKNQGENNGSSRNLDGRRLRTVTEAKVLAEYLAIKPNMEQKEKEARRKRWEQVVEIAEKKEEALKSASRGRVDGQWAEDREETVERTREAVTSAIKNGNYKDISFSKPEDASASSTSDSDEHPTRIENNPNQESLSKPRDASRSFYGFDDDDEFMSDDSSDADDSEESEEGGTGQA